MSADEKYFGIVSKELSIGRRDEALWTKAFALENGQESAAKARYIRMRVEQLQAADQNQEVPHGPGGDSDGISKPQGFDPSAVPKRDHSYRYDILPGAAVAALCKSIISASGFHGSPAESAFAFGIAAGLGVIAGMLLSRYVRTKVTKNRGSGFLLKLSLSIGLSLPFLGAAGMLSQPNFGGASHRNQQPATDFVNPFPPYSPGGASPQNQQPATGVFDPFAPAPAEPKEVTDLRKAAEQGNAVAQNNLGVSYYNGEGIPQNYQEAVKWFRLSAAQGIADAQNSLGRSYDAGQGVPQDYGEAVKWYRLAAAQGDDAAQNNLGVMYANGRGVPRNKVVAYALYNLAGANDKTNTATGNRNELAKRMTAQEIEAA
jgi:hypothetical protein